MKSNGETLRIGDLASSFGLAPNVLPHWEAMGLLRPARVEGNRRVYGDGDRYRVAVILRAKQASFSLDDIGEMLAATNPATRRSILRRRRCDLDQRIAQLQASRTMIDCALTCDHDDFTQCGEFQTQIDAAAGRAPLTRHWI
ncbi:DNA-binding transcriptional MerR regulator [Kribbella antiqua]|uniref:DNA-binding transcriptional MerR regulator n=1 Tax=Kribbella antiqua TaxID=2512217 RepID=A0A4R2IDR6_9ACTN|nr:MerR family transcriptional regulator [Kribbella antiqua]TCO42332.1 DNA-binding transcriptional MerR regulator [Kribbella antiqua]